MSNNLAPIFTCAKKFRCYFFAFVHRVYIYLVHKILSEIMVAQKPLSRSLKTKSIVSFFEIYVVMGYNNRVRQDKRRSALNLNTDVKRSRREAVITLHRE